MEKRKIKRETFSEKFLRGVMIGRQNMLKEKSLKGQYVIYEDNGKIIKEKASVILEREKKVNKLKNLKH
ncbi:MAG: hypothetical protein LH629_13230 [Ignavibacteria bacterium]|nr:hypothetical protein [Ignavibacteria bacterium]